MRKNRKKIQGKINKVIRSFNKELLNDNLWRGRFYVHQVDADWIEFKDRSGGILTVLIEARDKKTGVYNTFKVDNYGIEWDLFENMNDFIVEKSGVWKDINSVKNDKTNWEKVKWIPKKEVW